MAGRLITPPNQPIEEKAVTVTLPLGNEWIAPFLGAILFLADEGSWESIGGLSPQDTADYFAAVYASVSDQWEGV